MGVVVEATYRLHFGYAIHHKSERKKEMHTIQVGLYSDRHQPSIHHDGCCGLVSKRQKRVFCWKLGKLGQLQIYLQQWRRVRAETAAILITATHGWEMYDLANFYPLIRREIPIQRQYNSAGWFRSGEAGSVRVKNPRRMNIKRETSVK